MIVGIVPHWWNQRA